MAVDKSFVVKNDLEVNSDIIFADASSKKVGIASTGPRSTLDVRGGIAATDINITGVATIANLEVAAGDVTFGNLTVTGFSTLGGLSVDQLTVTGFTTFTDLSYDEINGRNLILTGIATIPQLDGITAFTDLNGTNATVGVATITTANVTTANVTTLAGYPNFSGGATVSGVVTAAQFTGAGQIGIGTSGGLVGYGVSFLDFRGPGFTTAQFNSAVGIVTLNFQGGGGSGSASIGVGSTPGDAFTGIITAGNLWYNTGLGRLFIYYQDDNSAQWVDAAPFNVGIITQLTSVGFSTGSVAAPSLTFGNESDRGFFAPASGELAFSSGGVGIVTFNSTGVLATTYFGDGSNLTGIDATTLKDSGGNIKAQANPAGVVVTGVLTATSFAGDGSALTGIDATSIKDSGGNVKAQANPAGVVVTGVLTATTGSFDGNVTIGGTLTYQDVTNIDSIGIITAQQGIQVLANGLTITGVSTFNDNVDLQDNDKILLGTGDDLQIYHDGSASYIAADDLRVTNNAVNETLAKFVNGGAVELYHNDSKKLETDTGGVKITGVCTATDFDSTSDARLKTNVQVVDGALSKVNELRGVSFNWIETGQPSYGVIAQELETVLPELVHGGDPKKVNYNGIIGVLIESIKELSARVDELENK